MAVAHAQPLSWHIVQANDGTLYAVIGGQRFTLEPDPISDDDLAGLYDAGDAGSYLQGPAMPSTPAASTPAATPTLLPAAVSATPATPHLGTPAPATNLAGSRENPVPLNASATLSDGWQLKVLNTEPDATRDLLTQNPGRPAPPPDSQFFVARVQLTNTSADARAFDASTRMRAVGASSTPYLSVSSACGNLSNGLPAAVVGNGATVAGDVCWAIQSRDAASLVLYDAPPAAANAVRIYFALH
ncbi:MAG: hypothetical protein JO057_10175 [Chloroflexi bacterium]|nr:hypothetical protein [Chloroflexota bacterium]